jgi:hypothetical protein
MKFLCLVYLEEHTLEALSRSDMDRIDTESAAYDRELQNSGHFIAAEALQPVQSAVTVRVRQGKVTRTDGPFSETKEFLGGFILIDARDLDQAAQIAAKIPLARVGSVEVRPILLLNRP